MFYQAPLIVPEGVRISNFEFPISQWLWRVITTGIPRVASANASCPLPAPAYQSVFSDCKNIVLAARRIKATRSSEKRTDQ